MTVYVLAGSWKYEGESVIGVFESPEEAFIAWLQGRSSFDAFVIYQCVVGQVSDKYEAIWPTPRLNEEWEGFPVNYNAKSITEVDPLFPVPFGPRVAP